jgi:hypothetical protein
VTTARRWLDQIGGPNALSIWSWLITLPLALMVGNLAPQSPSRDYNVLVWTATLLAIHVLLGVVMWVAAITLLPNRPRASRPVVALLVFAALGAGRIGLLELLDPILGPQGTSLESRLLTNVVGGTIVLALIAVLVDDYRTHAAIESQLRQAQASLQWLAEREPEALRAADLDEIARVRSQVEAELRGTATGPDHIRQISETVVRAQSHYLAEGLGPDLVRREPEKRSRREVTDSILRGLTWPNPLTLALVVELVAFPSVVTGWNLPIALANLLIAGSFIALAVATARRFIPLPNTGWARLLVIVGVLAAFGSGLSVAASVLVTAVAGPFPLAIGPAVVLLVVFGLGLSTWNSVTRDRQQRRQAMLVTVAEEAQALERVHGEVARRRAAAAEFLHGPIQSQLVASALKGESNEDALQAIERRFAEYSATSTTLDVQEQVNELAHAWADVMTITVTCSAETWNRLRRTPLTSRLLVDTLSEALTNSVRHGSVADVDVVIATDEIEDHVRVSLTVASLGTLTRGTGNGTGLARLMDRGANITLHQDGEQVVMRALL